MSAVLFVGCKKYLDKEPDNRTQVKTPEQIAQLLTAAYPQGTYILFCKLVSVVFHGRKLSADVPERAWLAKFTALV